MPLLAVAIPAIIAAGVVLFWRASPGAVVPAHAGLSQADLAHVARQQGNGTVPIVSVPKLNPTRSPERTLNVKPLGVRPAPPVEVRIPDLGIDAPVAPAGQIGDALQIPPPNEAGWYEGGPRPGEPGRAVIVGHLDTVDGPAVFAALPEIRRGMRIEIDAGNGTQHSFETIGVASVAKSSFPAQSVYAPSRRPTLALITCSGRFDQSTGHYEDNLIILARAT
jgi:sortase family protein